MEVFYIWSQKADFMRTCLGVGRLKNISVPDC